MYCTFREFKIGCRKNHPTKKKVRIFKNDTKDSVAKKVLKQEHFYTQKLSKKF